MTRKHCWHKTTGFEQTCCHCGRTCNPEGTHRDTNHGPHVAVYEKNGYPEDECKDSGGKG